MSDSGIPLALLDSDPWALIDMYNAEVHVTAVRNCDRVGPDGGKTGEVCSRLVLIRTVKYVEEAVLAFMYYDLAVDLWAD